MNNAIFKLGSSDLAKGILMAALTPVAGYLYQVLSSGSLAFDWGYLGKLALSGLMAYLLKNFFSDKEGKFAGKIG